MSESQKPLHGPAIPAVNLSKPGEVQRVISEAMQKQQPMPRAEVTVEHYARKPATSSSQ